MLCGCHFLTFIVIVSFLRDSIMLLPSVIGGTNNVFSLTVKSVQYQREQIL